MGYRTVSIVRARQMAVEAGLVESKLWRRKFRDGMAEHAAQLIISLAVKEKAKYDNRRKTAVAVGAAATKA